MVSEGNSVMTNFLFYLCSDWFTHFKLKKCITVLNVMQTCPYSSFDMRNNEMRLQYRNHEQDS